MKVTVIPVVTGTLRTVHKSLEKGKEKLEIVLQDVTIQSTALLRSTRILRRVHED